MDTDEHRKLCDLCGLCVRSTIAFRAWPTSGHGTRQKDDRTVANEDEKVEYRYCPSCGGALTERIEYVDGGSTVKSWLRYEYEGLDLLRIDERYDGDANGIDSGDPWRPINTYVHGPGAIGQIVKANWYKYDESGASPTTACESGAYYYFYDALGNVNGVLEEKNGLYHYYRWEMDAFGNDLSSGNDFLPMDQSGPKEHLTGKMYDTVTGLYYFHARWYEPEVGRFVGRDLLPEVFASPGKYCFVRQNPLNLVDPDGRFSTPPVFSETELPEWLRWFRGFRLMRKDVIAHESSSKGSAERYHCWGDPNNVKGGEAKVMGALPDVLTKNWLALGIYGRLFEGQWAARCEPTPLGEFFKGDCIYCKGDFTFYGFRAKVKLQIANKYIPYPVGSIAFFEWIDDGLYWTTASAPICMVGGEGGAGCNGWN